MVNLTIRLSKSGSNSGLKTEYSLLEADEASLPPHLVDADLPVVKGVGFLYPETCRINFVGVKAQRKPGDKVHICLMCNFPIAVYGRMDPCQHVFCFACAKRDSRCFLCKERVVRIQKVDVLVGLFICGAPGCLRSFLVRPDFELHVANDHSQVQQPESAKAGVSIGKASQSQIQSQHADLMIPASNSCASLQVTIPRKVDSQRSKEERTQKRRNSWESSRQGQNVRVNIKDQAHEGHHHRVRGGEYNYQSSRKREREREPRGAHPLNSSLSSSKQQQKPLTSLLPPPPYPPPNYSPAFPPLHEPNAGYPLRLEHPRELYSGMAMPPRPEHLDTNVLLQHAGGPLIGMQQGEWQALNFIPQAEGFGTKGPRAPRDGFGTIGNPLRPMQPQPDGFNPQMGPQLRPHFLSDQFGLPMGRPPMTVPRFHEGHLPPAPAGAPPRRTMTFNGPRPTTGPSSGELIVDYGWGLGNFGGAGGGHVFTRWLPATNS